ncbi:MAG: MvdD family ATP-grasp ribosomal peptide maturase [Snowella sp.]|nr:MvdD family ATP-grasp ribosomal peptide maturase [Snowella sp.]
MTVLIVTFSHDNESIPLVIKALETMGKKAFRLDTDRFPTEVKIDLYSGDQKAGTITDGEQKLELSEVSSIWYRRMRHGQKLPDSMDSQFREVSLKECRLSIRGMIASLPGFHLDPITNVDRTNHKNLQLQVARQLGLLIPRTLTSNHPEAVKQFAQNCQTTGIVTKMLSQFAIYGENKEEMVVFTSPVTEEDLDNLQGLQFCPMTFQENIPKALELRITIVGKQIFTAAIDSQQLDGAIYDWRKEGRALHQQWQAYDLPQTIEKQLLELMAYFGLNYGAIDMIVTPDQRYIFLEINPVGEFFWLELYPPHFPISQAIAKILLNS